MFTVLNAAFHAVRMNDYEMNVQKMSSWIAEHVKYPDRKGLSQAQKRVSSSFFAGIGRKMQDQAADFVFFCNFVSEKLVHTKLFGYNHVYGYLETHLKLT